MPLYRKILGRQMQWLSPLQLPRCLCLQRPQHHLQQCSHPQLYYLAPCWHLQLCSPAPYLYPLLCFLAPYWHLPLCRLALYSTQTARMMPKMVPQRLKIQFARLCLTRYQSSDYKIVLKNDWPSLRRLLQN